MTSCAKARFALALSFAAAAWLQAGAAHAQAPAPDQLADPLTAAGAATFTTLGDWGGVGLLQTRTARFAPDGAFETSYSFVDPFKRYALTLNALPWLEATFRYTEIRNQLYGQDFFSGDQRYKDRGADLKFRLLREGRYTPALAVGLQDVLGTGLFAGEYLVGSKRWRDFDFSLGLGWGQVGSAGEAKNPFANISDAFLERGGGAARGGSIAFGSLFRGATVGWFGGVEYRTPISGLTLKVEYDGHDYTTLDYNKPAVSQVNYGAVFRPYPWLEMSLGRERGTTTMLRLSLRTNVQYGGLPKQDPPPPAIGPRPSLTQLLASPAQPAAPVAPAARPAAAPPPAPGAVPIAPAPAGRAPIAPPPAAAATPAAAQVGEVYDALAGRGFALETFTLTGTEAVIAVTRVAGSAALRDAAVAAIDRLPPDVELLTLLDLSGGREAGRTQVRRSQAANLLYADDLYSRMAALALDVAGIDILGNDARVTVLPRERGRLVDLAAVAREANAALRLGGSVTAIDAATGANETWLAFGPSQPAPRPAPLPPAAAVVPTAPQRSTPAAGAGQDFRLPPIDLPYTAAQQAAVSTRMHAAMREQGLSLESLELGSRDAFVAVSAFRYRQFARNLGLAARVVANNLPASIEEVTIAFLNGGMEMTRVNFMRSELERAAAGNMPDEFLSRADFTPGEPWQPGDAIEERYPAYSWAIAPQLRQHVGGPDQFYLYQFWLALGASVDVTRGLTLSAQVGKNLYHNFDKIKLTSDSALPHVRSDIKEYLQQGENNIVALQANYMLKVSESVYTRLTVGLLEEMYGGVSTEVLYRPFASRLALGAEWNWVQKRAFDQRLTFLDYKVQTGHVSLYYDTPYKGVLASLHVGTYLAGDRGATIELSRRFDTGVRVGLWATFTNVPAERFGEGSFDKGFFVTIPMDVFFTRSVLNEGTFAFRPLTRDGGQRLTVHPRLYDVTSVHSLDAVTRDLPQILR